MDIVAGDLFIDSDVKQKLRRCLEDILNGNCPLYPVLRAIFGNNLFIQVVLIFQPCAIFCFLTPSGLEGSSGRKYLYVP